MPVAGSRDFDEIRQLLFGNESKKLDEIAFRVCDPDTRTTILSQDLPEAVRKRAQLGGAPMEELSSAMRPVVSHALKEEATQDREQFARVLFPVIGPAIRNSVAASFQDVPRQHPRHDFAGESVHATPVVD